jgi:glycosyltransferase involved in cell wall biosynthesis
MGGDGGMKVSVVLCAYTERRWDDLVAAVASVRAQTRPPDELIVVVDHCPALLRRARAELNGAVVAPNNAERGLSGARNSGVALSSGDVIAFLDDDAVADPAWLDRLLAAYTRPEVVAVGGRVLPRWERGRPAWFPPEFDWVVGCTYTGHRDDPGPVRNLIGANMSLRREVIELVGGFRCGIGRVDTTPTGCEETELCIRVAQSRPGAVVWYAPDARVHHRVPTERATWTYFRKRCLAEGLSKARVAASVGASDGLASESTYVRRAIPLAVLRDARASVTGERGAVARVLARVAGVLLAALGYVRERRGNTGAPSLPAFSPALVTQVDVAQAFRPLSDIDPVTGRMYRRAVLLVRRGCEPLGTVDVVLPPGGLTAVELERSVRAELDAELSALRPARTPAHVHPAVQPHVSVVIATRDRSRSLVDCIQSLFQCDYPSFDIVVVDNAPTSPTTRDVVERIADRKPGRILYLREDRPGLAFAHNRGLLETSAPIVAFTDDDVHVDPRWLSELVAGFAMTDDVGCVTGLIAPLELETEVQEWIERSTGFSKGMTPRVFDLGEHRPENPLFPYAAGTIGSGANMAFRRDVLHEMGGFDPALGAGTRARGGDDLAAFFDVLRLGHRVVYAPAAIVLHRHRRDYDGLRRQAFGYGVGLSAFLTKTVVDEPERLVEIGTRAPRGLAHVLHPRSAKNARVPDGYPAQLKRVERLGMAAGPFLYLASRIDTRRLRATVGQAP